MSACLGCREYVPDCLNNKYQKKQWSAFYPHLIQTNVALVSPLLRLENNHCHIEESEYVLKKAHKYSELIILYEKKGLHQKGNCQAADF